MSAHPNEIQQGIPKELRVSSVYLANLLFLSPQDLQVEILKHAEKYNTNLVNEQDENGQTLAHHIASNPAGIMGINPPIVRAVLENKADFSIRDNLGDTPMHSIANICGCDKDAAEMFYTFAHYAAKNHFDFSNLKNNRGRSVLHIAAFTRYGRSQTVASILNLAEKYKCKIDLDVLSATGATALFYLLNHGRFEEAKMLIRAGADVTKQGNFAADCRVGPDEPGTKHPYRYTLELLNRLSGEWDPRLSQMISSLQEIKTIMEAKLSHGEKEAAALQNFMHFLQEVSLRKDNNPELSEEENSASDQEEETVSQPLTTQTENRSLSPFALLSTSLPTSWGGRAAPPSKAAQENAELMNRETPGLKR